MKENVSEKIKDFRGLNELAMKGEIVVFGSTYMANFPFYNLINKSTLENAVYNRSIEALSLDEALEALPVCVLDLKPEKVFLELGENEYDDPAAIEKYARLVKAIRRELPAAKLYLICIPDERAAAFNAKLSSLCGKNVVCIRFTHVGASGSERYKTHFKELSCFFRDQPISMGQAFAMANL